jgi:hypothetical protein
MAKRPRRAARAAEDVYCGLRLIGQLAAAGAAWRAFSEPGGRNLGEFSTRDEAMRAIYERDVAERLAEAAQRSETAR